MKIEQSDGVLIIRGEKSIKVSMPPDEIINVIYKSSISEKPKSGRPSKQIKG